MKNKCPNCNRGKLKIHPPQTWWGQILMAVYYLSGFVTLAGIGCAMIGVIIWPMLPFAAILLIGGFTAMLVSAHSVRLICKAKNVPFEWECLKCGHMFTK